MVVDAGSAMPALFSAEIVKGLLGAVPGHTKSTLVGAAYTTETYSPFTWTRVPPSSVTVPEGFDSGVSTEASHRPARLAIDPGLQAGSARLAALKMPVITGFPESIVIVKWPVEDPFAELVAARVME
jgi:hypothetical protein